MRHHHEYRMNRRRNHFPFGYVLCSLLFMAFFGWKLFFLIPLFIMLACIGSWGRAYNNHDWQGQEAEKTKRKPKNDDIYDSDYV